MPFPRSAGLLLHLTSLPGRGSGDLGRAAYQFVEQLERGKQALWQMLPIGPVGHGGSPYQSSSSFAGNTLLISLEQLVEEGFLAADEVAGQPEYPVGRVDFGLVVPTRTRLLEIAASRYLSTRPVDVVRLVSEFRQRHCSWLEDFALFVSLKKKFGDQPWMEWEPALVHRHPETLRHWSQELADEIEQQVFLQWVFDRQWAKLRSFAHAHGVKLVGDLPVFVAQDSADVWSHQGLFQLDENGRPTVVAGVPPDYFSATGQLWGNPLYRWEVHASEGYRWWTSRLRRILELVDIVRIDHFRGFESHWEIPGTAPDASHGRWVKGPGADLFRAAETALGPLPVIAEDLGLITQEVHELRNQLGFPGMRVLQFSFGYDPPGEDSRPHAFPQNTVVYTGTHDNDTTAGWFRDRGGDASTQSNDQASQERSRALQYLGTDGHEIHWDMIRLAFENRADMAVVPVQDVLGLGSEARMNRPGIADGNWHWQLTEDAITDSTLHRLAELTSIYGRAHTAGSP